MYRLLSTFSLPIKDCVSTSSEATCHSTTEITEIDNLDECCNVERDYCPDDTPQGATVYATTEEYATSHPDLFGTSGSMLPAPSPGCPFDSDNDLVYDGADLCPDTTAKELEMTQDAGKNVLLDDKGCVILPPEMWEPTYDENAAAVSTIDGNPRLDLVFTIDKDLFDIGTLRGYSKLVDVQIMDAVCVDTLEGLIPVTIENDGEAAGPIPFTVGLDFDTDQLIGTELWTDEPNGVASISFCLKFSVLSYTDANGTFYEVWRRDAELLSFLFVHVYMLCCLGAILHLHICPSLLNYIYLQMKLLLKPSPSRQ